VIGYIGAPLAAREIVPSCREFESVIELAITDIGHPIKAVMPTEIGGSNALVPFYVASHLGLPVVDGDLLGRAFPEVQMISLNVVGIKPQRAYISNRFGQSQIITCGSFEEIESKARNLVVDFGSSAILIPIVLTGKQLKMGAIEQTVSQCIEIGHQKTLPDLCAFVDGKLHSTSMITDINYQITNGFLQGIIQAKDSSNNNFCITVKNEYLALECNNKKLSCAPDIISLLDKDTLEPILSDNICLGKVVNVMTCPGPSIWYTEAGKKIIGKL
jgi:hypothetical protein